MLPLLRAVADGQDHGLRDLITKLADEFRLTAGADRQELPPSGQQTVLANRVQVIAERPMTDVGTPSGW